MTSTMEIVATQAEAKTRRAIWEAQGANHAVTISEVGVFTAFDYRSTPPKLLTNTVPTAPAPTVWLVQVTIT